MKRLMSLMVVLIFAQGVFAQEATIDPRATKLLADMNKQFESYDAYEMDFKVVLQFPETEDSEVIKGKFIRKGENYQVISHAQRIFCNGEYVWIYAKNNNEVQITDAGDTGDDFVSPDKLFNLYKTGDYIYRVSREFKKNGQDLVEIEFKPTDSMSDFFKIKMILTKGDNQPKSFKIFYKDGMRMTTTLDKLIKNKVYKADFFTFDMAKYPGVKVEDLRL